MAADEKFPRARGGAEGRECILCGKCLSVCPLFLATRREELSPRAKFFLARTMREGGAVDEARASDLAALCLSCGRCEKACSQGLCGPELAADLRAAHPDFSRWLWRTWVSKASLLWPMAASVARFAPDIGPVRKVRALKSSDIEPWLKVERFDRTGEGRQAVLFAGCAARYGRTSWETTARTLIQGLGFDLLDDPGFNCCACTLGHAGERELQKRMQRANLDAWRAAGCPEILVFCATCRCGLRSYATEDLDWEPFEQEKWLQAVVPLAARFGDTAFTLLENAPDAVYYHRPCHGSGNNPDLAFLQRATDGRISKAGEDVCCGFGGVMQLGAPDLSARVARECWNFYDPAPGAQVLTGCSACALQLAATAPDKVLAGHWLEILG